MLGECTRECAYWAPNWVNSSTRRGFRVQCLGLLAYVVWIVGMKMLNLWADGRICHPSGPNRAQDLRIISVREQGS